MHKLLAAVGVALALAAGSALAEEIVHDYEGRKLVGELTLAPGKEITDGAILMVHGTLAHKDMEIMAALRDLLQERGFSTLSINLSLGLSERRGMYDCAVTHRHYHREALLDIGVWMQWLEDRGVAKVTLLGHSRGGNQVAWYAFEKDRVPNIKSLVLIAPMTWTRGQMAADYGKRWGTELQPLLDEAGEHVKRGRSNELLGKKVGFLYCPDAVVTAKAFFDYYVEDSRKDTPLILRGVERPALVIAAGEDAVVPDLVEKIKRWQLEEEQVTLKVVEGADHFFRDLFADEVADMVAEFLAAEEEKAAKAQ